MAKLSSLSFLLLGGISCLSAMEKNLANLRNAANWTPLHTAASIGNPGAIETLIDFGADLEARDSQQRTPLILSADAGNTQSVRALLKKMANVQAVDAESSSALHKSCHKGHVDVVEELVARGASLDLLDKDKQTPLHHALAYRDFTDLSVMAAIQKALKKKFDIEAAAQGFAFHRACQADSPEGLEALVLKGARLDELDKNGNSPLHYAAANTNPEILKTLLAALKKRSEAPAIPTASLLSLSSELPLKPTTTE